MRSQQCGLRSITLDNLPGTKYGDRLNVWATGILTRRTCPSAGRAIQTGWAPRYGDRHDVRGMAEQTEGQTRYSTQTWGQARCPVYRSGTLNVKRSTLNF